MRVRGVAVGIAMVMLNGCQSASVGEMWASARPANSGEKAVIIEGMRQFLRDPYSVRDVEISQVVTLKAVGGNVRQVCVRGNAKNAYGGYTGKQTYLVYIGDNGQITHADQGPSMSVVCSRLSFIPFPEAVNRLQRL